MITTVASAIIGRALTRLLAGLYWRERIREHDWPWHDEFINEVRRIVAPDYVWNVNPRRPRPGQREARYDPLLEWKKDIRYLQYQPPPQPDSPWLMPETLDLADSGSDEADHGAADRVGSETWDGSGRQTIPQT